MTDDQPYIKTLENINGPVFKMACWLLKSDEEARDVVQEVYFKLWSDRRKYKHYLDLTAIALRIGRNKSLDRIRSKKRWNHVDVNDQIQIDSTNPLNEVEFNDSHKLMRSIIDNLPPKEKSIIYLRAIDQKSIKEIVEITGLTENNVRVILSRARKNIKETYNRLNP